MKNKSHIVLKVLSLFMLMCAWVPFVIGLCMLKYPTVRNVFSIVWLVYILSMPIFILILCWKDKKKMISVGLSILYIFTYVFPLAMYLNSNNMYYIFPLISKTESIADYNDFDTLSNFTDIMSDEEIRSFLPKNISDEAEYEYLYVPGNDALKIRLKFKTTSEEISSLIDSIKWNPIKRNHESCTYYYDSNWPYTYRQICVDGNGEIEYLLLVNMVSDKAFYDTSFYCQIESIL